MFLPGNCAWRKPKCYALFVRLQRQTNSFLLKGWSVVLVAALFALSAQNSDVSFIFLAYIPAVIFWGLDGYFLWQEGVYRKLYDQVRLMGGDQIDFSMDTSGINSDGDGWTRATFSITLVVFHGVLIGAVLVVMFIQISI